MARDLTLWQGEVKTDWIDYNGHLNDGYYAVAFSLASERFLERIGVYREYRERTRCTVYTVETHICYLRELKVADPITVSCQLLGFDTKRIHLYLEMRHASQAYVAASYETLLLHVDQSVPKVLAMPEEISEKLELIAREQVELNVPNRAGKSIKSLKSLD